MEAPPGLGRGAPPARGIGSQCCTDPQGARRADGTSPCPTVGRVRSRFGPTPLGCLVTVPNDGSGTAPAATTGETYVGTRLRAAIERVVTALRTLLNDPAFVLDHTPGIPGAVRR